MNEQQLAELECHLAAGNDLATALEVVAEDRPAQTVTKRTPWGFLIGLAAGLAWWLLRA